MDVLFLSFFIHFGCCVIVICTAFIIAFDYKCDPDIFPNCPQSTRSAYSSAPKLQQSARFSYMKKATLSKKRNRDILVKEEEEELPQKKTEKPLPETAESPSHESPQHYLCE